MPARRMLTHTVRMRRSSPGGKLAANCQDCHGGAHEVLAGGAPNSPVNHANIPDTCGRCHGQKFLMESSGVSAQPFISYQESVHGRAVEERLQEGRRLYGLPRCAHDILPPNDPKSPISKFNVPATCGKCHADVKRHLQCRAFTARPSRVATNRSRLHGLPWHPLDQVAHSIRIRPSPSKNVSRDTCARCHEGVRLSQEFGVPGNRVSTLHGQLSRPRRRGGSRGRRELLQLSRRAQHSPVERSAFDHQSARTWQRPAASATREQRRNSRSPRCIRPMASIPKTLGSVIAMRWVRIIYIILILPSLAPCSCTT